MTELEFTRTMDEALLISEDEATKVANEILHDAPPRMYLMFAKYCRDFLVDEDKYDLRGATPSTRRELLEKYSKAVQMLDLLIELDTDSVV
jgi:hypothetical protein